MKPFCDYHLGGGVHRLRRHTAHCCFDWDNNQVEGSMSGYRYEDEASTTLSHSLATRSLATYNSRLIAPPNKVFP
jgi:hypothetical protein